MDDNDCVPMSQADMFSVTESMIKPNSMSNLSTVNHCQCDQPEVQMSSMRNTIAELNTKVEFLVLFLGSNSEPIRGQVQSSSDDQAGLSSGDQASSAVSNGSLTNKVSYANSVRSKPAQLSSQMHQAVMSAVYVDLHSKSARANNVIISGLPKVEHTGDKDPVGELIAN